MIGHANIDLDQLRGRDASVCEFSSSLEPILRLSIEDYDDTDDDGWMLSFIGVTKVEMKPLWRVDRFEIESEDSDSIVCKDTSNGFEIVCREIALIPGNEAWDA